MTNGLTSGSLGARISPGCDIRLNLDVSCSGSAAGEVAKTDRGAAADRSVHPACYRDCSTM